MKLKLEMPEDRDNGKNEPRGIKQRNVCDHVSERLGFQPNNDPICPKSWTHNYGFLQRHEPIRNHSSSHTTREKLVACGNWVVEVPLIQSWVIFAKKGPRMYKCVWTVWGGGAGKEAATVRDVVRNLKNPCVNNTSKMWCRKPDMVAQAWNPSIWEAVAKWSGV